VSTLDYCLLFLLLALSPHAKPKLIQAVYCNRRKYKTNLTDTQETALIDAYQPMPCFSRLIAAVSLPCNNSRLETQCPRVPARMAFGFGPDSTTSQSQLYSQIQIHLLGLPKYCVVILRQMDVLPLLDDDGVGHKQEMAGPRT